MTEGYKKNLIKMAKELIEMKGSTTSAEAEIKQVVFFSKLNHLLGYILALEEIDTKK